MPQINLKNMTAAFHNGKQVLSLYQGPTKIWPEAPTAAVSGGQNVSSPVFDVVIEKGVTKAYSSHYTLPGRNDAPFSAGMAPYGFPMLAVKFYVAAIEGATGPVHIKFGIMRYPGQDLQPGSENACFFCVDTDITPGQFYSFRLGTTMGWDNVAPESSDIETQGEVTGATKVMLTNLSIALTW